jgi:hypothetical protein
MRLHARSRSLAPAFLAAVVGGPDATRGAGDAGADSLFADATTGACEVCTVAYCATCSDATSCDECIASREVDVGTGACVKLQCDVSTLVLNTGQAVVAVPPGELNPVTRYAGNVDYLDTVKVVCDAGAGYINGTAVDRVGQVFTDGVTAVLPMKFRAGSTIMCGNESAFWPG